MTSSAQANNDNEHLEGVWLAFSNDVDETMAVQRFIQRFGFPPETVVRSRNLLLLGPVTEDLS